MSRGGSRSRRPRSIGYATGHRPSKSIGVQMHPQFLSFGSHAGVALKNLPRAGGVYVTVPYAADVRGRCAASCSSLTTPPGHDEFLRVLGGSILAADRLLARAKWGCIGRLDRPLASTSFKKLDVFRRTRTVP
jgi:hypothetical protein